MDKVESSMGTPIVWLYLEEHSQTQLPLITAIQLRSIEYFSPFLNPAIVTPIQLPSVEIEMNELKP